jgi:hypothetical protein
MENTSVTEGRLAPIIEKLTAWAAGPNPAVNTPDEGGRVAGFGLGFWHGMIAPVALLISLFRPNVHVFEVHNNGKAYIAGFLLGVMTVWGGGGRAGARRRR